MNKVLKQQQKIDGLEPKDVNLLDKCDGCLQGKPGHMYVTSKENYTQGYEFRSSHT